VRTGTLWGGGGGKYIGPMVLLTPKTYKIMVLINKKIDK